MSSPDVIDSRVQGLASKRRTIAEDRGRRAAELRLAEVRRAEHRVGEQARRPASEVDDGVLAEARLAEPERRPEEADVVDGVGRFLEVDDARRERTPAFLVAAVRG